jgi:hypothetical protein
MFSGNKLSRARSLLVKSMAVVAVLASLSLVTKASASPAASIVLPGVGLDTLLNGGSIQVGDKIFADFSISGFDAAGVTVIGIEENGHYGIRLQGGFAAFGNQIKDILIGFSVSVAPESDLLISGVHLDFNGAVAIGSGFASVVETAVTPSGQHMLLPPLVVLNPPPILSASADLVSPQKKIYVLKDIMLIAGGDTAPHKRLGNGDNAVNAVLISQIDQLFVQIPEPGTVVLVAAGLLGVAITGRRRK